ncbi:bifunctional folylpolyglutamate synthase/dihydrofolate synthase [bacterium]|nr:bifunctional folylpolyglutamate synthase/dihydrofolate synthase [bacterium]
MDDQALSYHDTVDWLFGLQFVGIKLGLENIRSLAEAWGNPQQQYPVIHIAGSNGKGSTASFIAAALQAAGYRTGLYTSPHLVDFSERIRIDGTPISSDAVVEYAQRLRPDIERLNATFFEATTLMAFAYFADREVDVAVIETGLGGRLDATNVVTPVLSVITSLSIEHREFLGDTLTSIATEKGGIIKPGVPVVTTVRSEEPLAVLRGISTNRRAPLHVVDVPREVPEIVDLDMMRCELPGLNGTSEIGLIGKHQVENAALAVAVLGLLAATSLPLIDEKSMRTGLREVRVRSGLRGRLERLQQAPEIVIDVGHNPDGVMAMLDAWLSIRSAEETDILLGVLEQKDLRGILLPLTRKAFRSITLIEAHSHEAKSLNDMRREAERAGLHVQSTESSLAWLREKTHAARGSALVFGSHYVVGAFLREWPKKMHLS